MLLERRGPKEKKEPISFELNSGPPDPTPAPRLRLSSMPRPQGSIPTSPAFPGSLLNWPRPSYLDIEAAHTSVPPGGVRDMYSQRSLSSGGGASDDLARSFLNRDPTGPTRPTRPLRGGRVGVWLGGCPS